MATFAGTGSTPRRDFGVPWLSPGADPVLDSAGESQGIHPRGRPRSSLPSMTAVAGASPCGRPRVPLPRMPTAEKPVRLLLIFQPHCPHPEGRGPSTYIVSPRRVGKEINQ
jgi:hypothetical protein